MTLGRCHFCRHQVDSTHAHAFRVVGWEAVRGRGGANAIIDRQRLGATIAHVECAKIAARRRRRGIADGQGSLA